MDHSINSEINNLEIKLINYNLQSEVDPGGDRAHGDHVEVTEPSKYLYIYLFSKIEFTPVIARCNLTAFRIIRLDGYCLPRKIIFS